MERKSELIQQLKAEIMALEKFPMPKPAQQVSVGLGSLESSFSGNSFPVGVVHELISGERRGAASTNGFIAALLGRLMRKNDYCLWISNQRTLFPPGLKSFGVEPDRIIFIDIKREKEVLWAVEQSLKCGGLAAVVAELKEISFAQSQRLQLAVEKSRVTGFLHRYQPMSEHALACATRWKIKPLPSVPEDGLPGLGFPRWQVELIKARNGKSGRWQLECRGGRFQFVPLEETWGKRENKQHYA
jgi:protein ImuA